MRYVDYVKRLRHCPFCRDHGKFSIVKNDTAELRVCNAPYTKDHIIVIPRRHVFSFLRLRENELKNIDSLVKFGVRLLEKKGYKSVSILLRNGKAAGKSISHLHYHLIPKIHVGPVNINPDDREVISIDKEVRLVDSFRKLLK